MATTELTPGISDLFRHPAGALVAQALQRWWRALPRRRSRHPHATPRPGDDELAALVGLDASTLRDIGAPERLLARALAHRETQRGDRDALRLGIASGAWQHW